MEVGGGAAVLMVDCGAWSGSGRVGVGVGVVFGGGLLLAGRLVLVR